MFFRDLDVAILSTEQFQFSRKKRYKLGSGGFGDVYRGTYNGETVAVKCFAKQAKPHASSVSIEPRENQSSKADIVSDSGISLSSDQTRQKAKGKFSSLKRRVSSFTGQSKDLLWRSTTTSRPRRSQSNFDAPTVSVANDTKEHTSKKTSSTGM